MLLSWYRKRIRKIKNKYLDKGKRLKQKEYKVQLNRIERQYKTDIELLNNHFKKDIKELKKRYSRHIGKIQKEVDDKKKELNYEITEIHKLKIFWQTEIEHVQKKMLMIKSLDKGRVKKMDEILRRCAELNEADEYIRSLNKDIDFRRKKVIEHPNFKKG